ncbi:L-2-amino-thiazoline-4-carboxylic acid hydrolase [Nocardia sp. NPDC101769]|uniref:L-2-amino-thiazoline-4-carboxylic acid hydrolase n=1 Tax=Nocardia sp. NPDC101769 TaxID=3364333 RepID=UPI00381DA5A4
MNTDPFDIAEDGYVPDPERDLTIILEAFFERIAVTLRENDVPATLLTDMRRLHAELEAASADRVVDEPSRYNLRMTVALVAAYRLLQPRLGRAKSIEAVEIAFVEPLGDAVRESTRAILDGAPDPFRAMVELAKSREEQAFGPTFTFEHPFDDERRYRSDVVRCFYHDVLVDHSVAELTPVMCEFDANWIAAIDPERHGFRFERSTTIGWGGTHCPFHWERTDH